MTDKEINESQRSHKSKYDEDEDEPTLLSEEIVEKKVNFENQRVILWIDPNDNSQDLAALKKSFPNDIIEKVDNIPSGLEFLGDVAYEFRLIYVITSGAVSQKFMDEYEKNLQATNVITANIIYCMDKERHKQKVFFEDPFFNPGKIATELNEVIQFIKEFDVNFYENCKALKEYKPNEEMTFKNSFKTSTVAHLSKLAYPTMLAQIINSKMVTEEGIKAFVEKIRDYPNEIKGSRERKKAMLSCVYPQRNLPIKFPFYFYSKFFLRLYTMETPFYKNINKDLSNGLKAEYDQFIKCLFLGLREHYLHSVKDVPLYRGSSISKAEFQEIKRCYEETKKKEEEKIQEKIKEKIKEIFFKIQRGHTEEKEDYLIGDTDVALTVCTAKCFLSFGKDEKVVDKEFIGRKFVDYKETHKDKGLMIVKYIIEPIPQNTPYFVSNIDVGDLSAIKDEKEVLILPKSSFKVASIDEISEEDLLKQIDEKSPEEVKVTTIHLQHLNEYAKQINDYVTWQSKNEIKDFFENAGLNMAQTLLAQSVEEGKKIVVWIDQFAKCIKYSEWIEEHKEELKDFTIIKQSTVEKGFRVLANYPNKLIYVIVSGYLFKEFTKQFKEKAKKLRLITANIVLCESPEKEVFEKYKKLKFIGDPFFNPGGIVNTFPEVIEYLLKDETKISVSKNDTPEIRESTYGSTFSYLETDNAEGSIAELFNDYAKKPELLQEQIIRFAKFVAAKYKDDELTELAYPGLEKNAIFPISVYAINFLKMYMKKECPFFTDMNRDLTNKHFTYFYPYIYIMYSAIKDKELNSYSNGDLYRGCKMSKTEIEALKSLKGQMGKIIYTKPFLSFTMDEKIADDYVQQYKKEETDSVATCKLIIKKPPKAFEGFFWNIMTGKYSQFSKYQEILILPLTCFTVADVNTENGIDTITLNFMTSSLFGFAGLETIISK